MKIKITKKSSSMYFYQPKYNIIRLINKWMLNERWVQGELFVNTGECTVSVNREKWRAQVNTLWVHEKMGKLNFLYLYHGSIGQYHFNNETSFLLPGWIMGLEKWWYWQTLSLKDNWCHSACLNTTVHNSTVKWQPKIICIQLRTLFYESMHCYCIHVTLLRSNYLDKTTFKK